MRLSRETKAVDDSLKERGGGGGGEGEREKRKRRRKKTASSKMTT